MWTSGALALALLFSFVPRPYGDLLVGRLRLPVLGRAVPRVHLYFALCVLAGISAGLNRRLLGGLLFNLAALVFIWPLVSVIVAPLGLRTAGNFTMFSNLRTEGAVSNHFLLGSNPLKLWNYQEDAVRFIRIDDRRAGIGYQYQPLEGNRPPVVEFRKLISAWARADRRIPMTFEYHETIYSTKHVTHDPVWRPRGRDWETRLMDFRVIQPEGPNSCRW